MKFRKVTAIINKDRLEHVEKALMAIGVTGVSISQVCGYGEYHNFYQSDMMCQHSRVEVFCEQQQVDSIVQAVMQAAHLGQADDGIIAVLPVEELYRIRTQSTYDA